MVRRCLCVLVFVLVGLAFAGVGVEEVWAATCPQCINCYCWSVRDLEDIACGAVDEHWGPWVPNCLAACGQSQHRVCIPAKCGGAADCEGSDEQTCPNTMGGAPDTPTCTDLGEVTGTPQTISWTSGGILTDTYLYKMDSGIATDAGNVLSKSVPVSCGAHTWQALARNTTCSTYNGNEDSAWSIACNLCRRCEPTMGEWSACDANHKRTRSCIDNDGACGGDDCVLVEEDCTGEISGALFDASNYESCPGDLITNPENYSDVLIKNRSFLMSSPYGIPAWPPSENGDPKTLTTDGNGFYSTTAFSPGVYSYDFANLGEEYVGANDPKLRCTGFSTATLWGSDPSCLLMPCLPASTNNSFGFRRVYGGWWQATGGSVYAGDGIRSIVPATIVPSEDQKLILADANGRTGMLSYGVPWAGTELGTNPNVAVSDDLWKIESLYNGLRYDYDYYDTRMSVFASTDWDGGDINYTGGASGYQIFRHAGNVTLNYGGPTGTEKVILLVDGDVVINGNVAVPAGAFLAIVASGDITFGSAVMNAEGWFVAENISIPCHDGDSDGVCDKDDVQFVGEGSFVGWTRVSLRRDMYTENNTTPSEKFVYRPDLVLNVPTPMKVYTRKFMPFIP